MRSGRAGYTLLEMLLYGVVLAMIVNLSTSLFLSARRIQSLGETSLERVSALGRMEEDFRASALAAVDRVDSVPGVRMTRPILALRGAAEDGSQRYFTWRQGESGALIHETFEVRGGSASLTSQSGYAIDVRGARADVREDLPGVIALVVDVDTRWTKNTVPASNRFVSRLGGGHGP